MEAGERICLKLFIGENSAREQQFIALIIEFPTPNFIH